MNRYLGALYRYGFITLCYLIQEYEKEENYEECAIILSALNKHNDILKDSLPTRMNDDCIKYWKDSFMEFGLSGTFGNVKYYAEETKRMIDC